MEIVNKGPAHLKLQHEPYTNSIRKANAKIGWGFSLIEILIVVLIFSVIGILLSQTVILTLQTTKKSDTTARVRENVDFVLAVIDRQLHSASSITSACTGSTETQIDYTDVNNQAGSFSCVNTGSGGYIASGSAQLTSSQIAITACSFTCTKTTSIPFVTVAITARDSQITGLQNATVSASTKIYLRTY